MNKKAEESDHGGGERKFLCPAETILGADGVFRADSILDSQMLIRGYCD